MSSLTYNGIVIGEPLRMIEYRREPVYNGPDYLYDAYTVRVQGVWNPKSTSYAAPVAFAPPVAEEGKPPVITEKAVRHQLSQARATLIYSVGGQDLLQSPAAGATVDAANGPFPVVNAITEILGNKTFLIDFGVRTCVNEAALYRATPSVLLSNRWTNSHAIDRDHFTTTTISGRAIFRSDRLEALASFPDDFRAHLFRPVPEGCRRMSVHVEEGGDGLSCTYELVDRQLPIAVVADGVSWLEATHTTGITSPGAEEAAWQIGKAGVGGLQSVMTFFGGGDKTKFADASGLVSAAVGLADTVRGNVPRLINRVHVRVFGNPNSNRQRLLEVAYQVITSRMSEWQAAMANTRIFATADLMGRFVEVTADFQLGPFQGVGFSSQVLLGNGSAMTAVGLGRRDDIPGITSADPGVVHPALPNDSGARGTYLERCVAAALLGQNAVPAKPPAPGQFVARTPP